MSDIADKMRAILEYARCEPGCSASKAPIEPGACACGYKTALAELSDMDAVGDLQDAAVAVRYYSVYARMPLAEPVHALSAALTKLEES